MPFAIGVEHPKTLENLGVLMRSAYNFQADMVFTVGNRYRKHRTDTQKTFTKIPIMHFDTWESYRKSAPMGWIPVGVELTEDATDIREFIHPKCCVYLLGPEDGSLSKEALVLTKFRIKIPSVRCLNLAVAGSIVMFDRAVKTT